MNRFSVAFALFALVVAVYASAVPESEDTVLIDGEVDAADPYKAIFFPDRETCRFCRAPCSGLFCCDGKWPRCCQNNGNCRCCG